jgi:hypothetical protein
MANRINDMRSKVINILKVNSYYLILNCTLSLILVKIYLESISRNNYNLSVIIVVLVSFANFLLVKYDWRLFTYLFVYLIFFMELSNEQNPVQILVIFYSSISVVLILYSIHVGKKRDIILLATHIIFTIILISVLSYDIAHLIYFALTLCSSILYKMGNRFWKNMSENPNLSRVLFFFLILFIISIYIRDLLSTLQSQIQLATILLIFSTVFPLSKNIYYTRIIVIMLVQFLLITIFGFNVYSIIFYGVCQLVILGRYKTSRHKLYEIWEYILPVLLVISLYPETINLEIGLLVLFLFSLIFVDKKSIFKILSRYLPKLVNNAEMMSGIPKNYHAIDIDNTNYENQNKSYPLCNSKFHYNTLGWFFNFNPNLIIDELYIKSQIQDELFIMPALNYVNLKYDRIISLSYFVDSNFYRKSYNLNNSILPVHHYFELGWRLGMRPRKDINISLVIVQLYSSDPREPISEFLKFYSKDFTMHELQNRPRYSSLNFFPFN